MSGVAGGTGGSGSTVFDAGAFGVGGFGGGELEACAPLDLAAAESVVSGALLVRRIYNIKYSKRTFGTLRQKTQNP